MRVRVATLNVWALPGPFSKKVDKRMAAIGDRLHALDVDAIAFQEVWTAEARGLLLEAGRRVGLEHVWHKDAAIGGSGLLVLSRLPIERKRFDRFALRGYPERLDHADYYGGKGFVKMELRTGAGPITLMDTHLHARYAKDMPNEYRPQRAAQVVELAFAARESRNPVVTLGDFNFEEPQAEYRVLTGLAGFRDVAAELDRRDDTVWGGNAYRGTGHPGKRIDFVFVRNGSRTAVVARRVERIFDQTLRFKGRKGSYSDHAGLLAELELEPRASAPAAPDPQAIELARRMLREGRSYAESRRSGLRACAGAGFGLALLAAASVRSGPVTRRRLLRAGIQGLGLAALTPGLGFSLLSEVVAADEIRAYEALHARLEQLESAA